MTGVYRLWVSGPSSQVLLKVLKCQFPCLRTKSSVCFTVSSEMSVSFTGIFWIQTAGAEFQMGVNIKRGIPDVSDSSLGEEK